jgi:uncharacterized protein (TIGR02246 family)
VNREEAYTIVQRQAHAWDRADPQAVAADFAPEGVLISPGGRWQGRDAIRKAAESFFAASTDIKVDITRVLADGEQGAVEWTWSETDKATGRRHKAEDAIIFTVRDGKITYWREYIDKGKS